MRRRISQREAHELHKRVEELERRERNRRSRWAQEWFGGVNIASIDYSADHSVSVAVRTARALNHAVVVIGDDGGRLRLMALPHPQDSL